MPLDSNRDELAAWLRLSLEPNLGLIGAIGLLRAAGTPEDIYAMRASALARHLPPELARQLAAPAPPEMEALVERTLRWAEGADRHIVTLADPRYPPSLLTTADPPLLLYVRGQPSRLHAAALAVVGARSATAGGVENARAFARYLAGHGWCVASGLAQGIDAAAHEGALDAGPRGAGTVAVMGTGIDLVYPPRHAGLADRIAAQGALVSELPLGSSALPHHFPRRNRLVAGLASGVLVVEAARQSGSLITARLAAENGREVFAIPGSIHSPLSRGCHALIRQGAKLVETARDITDELGEAGRDAADATPAGRPRARRSAKAASRAPDAGTMDAESADSVSGGSVSGDSVSADSASADPASDDPVSADPAPADSASADPFEAGMDGSHDDAGRAREDDPVLAALGHDPVHLDTLLARTGLDSPALGARLLELELTGMVARLDGGRFQRLAGARRAAKG
jgi:DNA processing protein